MKLIKLLLLFVFLQTFAIPGKKSSDSIAYYLELANYNIEDKFNYSLAIKNIEIAIEIAKKTNKDNELHDAYYLLGNVQMESGKYNEAIVNLIRYANFYQTKKTDQTKLAKCYFNLGNCYLQIKNKPLSEIYFKKSYDIYNKLDLFDVNYLIELEKGLVLKYNNKIDEALFVFNDITTQDNGVDQSKIEAYYQVSLIYSDKKQYQQSLNAALKAFELCNNQNIILPKIKLIKKIIFNYEKLNDFKNAYKYAQQYLLKSENLNFNKEQDNYLFSKKKFDDRLDIIEQLEKEKLDQQKTIRFSRLISVLSIALIAILSLLSFSLYKNNKIRKHTFQVLQEKNKELTVEKEKAIQASNARADFLSTVSHELRTPLNGINGITYLLLNEKPKPSQLQYLKSLEFSGKYLLDYINDILEINRLESDKVEVEKIKFNLPELVQNITTTFKEFIQENNVEFKANINLNNIEYFEGDPTKIAQILINLINNAIKFTKNGKVWLTLNRIDENLVYFEVKDNGMGIPKDKIDNIFDSFTQGSVAINRTFGGTGLGLSIVKKIIEILNSKIYLSSKEKVGTTFNFTLQLNEITTEVIAETETRKRLSLKNKTVLLVEDNKINQMITQKMVENKGMICTTIDNGEEAVEMMKNYDFDVVLMDVHLPGINGTEATAAIRKFNAQTPIIALTAISLNENRENLISFGMNDVVTKPFNPDVFYTVLSKYV